MAATVKDVMTRNTHLVRLDDAIIVAAQLMRDENIGDVIVSDNGTVRGILTDRDIVVRAVAEGMDAMTATVDAVYSGGVTTVTPDTSVDEAAQIMREKAIRRLPVVEDSQAVGVVSLGDLAMERNEGSALADISAAQPNT
jgi:CBS domain-containing protein